MKASWFGRLVGLPGGRVTAVEGWNLEWLGAPSTVPAFLGAIVVVVALLALAWWCYRLERGLRPGQKAVLWILRAITILLLLAVWLQPAVVWRVIERDPGNVVVLLDGSASMSWRDRYRSNPDEAQRLARLAGLAEEEVLGAQPPSRFELAQRILTATNSVIRDLAREHHLSLMRFGTPQPGREAYTRLLADCTPPRAGETTALSDEVDLTAWTNALAMARPDGLETRIGRALRQAVDAFVGQPPSAVVLISDGRNTERLTDRAQEAGHREYLEMRGVPVLCVAAGRTTPPRNITVTHLQGPDEVRLGATIALQAYVSGRGYEDGASHRTRVTLYRRLEGDASWEPTGVSAPITLGGPSTPPLQEVTLRTSVDTAGRYEFRAHVEPDPEEERDSDNEAQTSVKVTDEKIAVLLVSGDAGWEFQYLRNFLLRQPEWFRTATWLQGADPEFEHHASPGFALASFPADQESLFAFDVVILCDPRYQVGEVDGRFVELLKAFVARHHGGLCFVSGQKHTSRVAGPDGTLPELGDLLPVELARDSSSRDRMSRSRQKVAWPLQRTVAGRTRSLLQLAPTPEAAEAAWRSLPPLFWTHPVRRAKPLATVLACSMDPARRTRAGAAEPVIAVQFYGRGRVLYMGCDRTWRWRATRDNALYRTFWSNAGRFLSAGRLQKRRVLVLTPSDRYTVGADIHVRVEAHDAEFVPIEGETFTVRLRRNDASEPVDHILRATGPGIYEGIVQVFEPGGVEIVPWCTHDNRTPWSESDMLPRRLQVTLPQQEFLRPEADWAALQEIASVSNGVLSLAEFDALAERLPDTRRTEVRRVTRTLWNTMAMLLLIVAFLTLEWSLRKRYDLA